MAKRHTALTLAAAVASAGCTAVNSTHIDATAGRTPPGLHYALPKALFRIELFDRNGELLLGVSRPILVGDPDATYVLNASPGLLTSQEYLFVVEPDTRLLTYINSVSEGEAGAIIENIARSFGTGQGVIRSESSRGRNDLVIYSKIVDPLAFERCDYGSACTFTAIGAELRSRALDYLACDDLRNDFQIAMCGRITSNPGYFAITLEPMFAVAPAARRAFDPADCRKSVCYRAPAPYRMGLRVAGVTDVSEMVLLPNEAPVMSMAIPAGVFADARARMELYQGMPASYAVDRKNELLAITLLPAAIVKGFFEAVSSVFQFRINLNSNEARVLESETALDRAEDARRDYLASRTPSGLIGDAPENSRAESSRPMDDPRGQLTTSQGASVAKDANDPGPLFEVPLSRRAAETPPVSGQDLSQ